MIADMIESCDIRLITHNVMAVFSTKDEYVENFIRRLKKSHYLVNNTPCTSDKIISYTKKNYNIYENIFRFVSRCKHVDEHRFVEYLNYINLSHLLWLHFYELDSETLSLVETLMRLSSNKRIIIIDYIDNRKHSHKLYSLLFHIGLEDKLIIVPFRNINDAINNSTCQCYVKSKLDYKIQPSFSSEFLNTEFNSDHIKYNGERPLIYENSSTELRPYSYKYSFYELLLITLFSIKMFFITLYNWRLSLYVS